MNAVKKKKKKKKKKAQQDLPFPMKKKTQQKLSFIATDLISSKMPKILMMLWIWTLTLKFNSAFLRCAKSEQ
jgi:hypothetical protein